MQNFNPNIHHRRSIRLPGYDYSQARKYFITICCHEKICRFGKIENMVMILNEFGQIAFDQWLNLSERFTNFDLDVFQIMPNHIHAIISLRNIDNTTQNHAHNSNNIADLNVGATLAVALNHSNITDNNNTEQIRAGVGASPAPTNKQNHMPKISAIIGAYKSIVANDCLQIYKKKNLSMGKFWQRNYYEHIIRNEQIYLSIVDYIICNPAKWKDDKFYSDY